MQFSNKDHLAHYMIAGHLHLSKKDYGFFNNIKNIVHDNKPVTSNQDKLFNKLLFKYQRQLTKLNYNVTTLINLPWSVEVLESKQEYLNARISIENDKLIIRSPFNNKFIQMFRKLSMNEFVWDKTRKFYIAPLSTYQLKIAIQTVTKCYESVVYCDKIQEILNEVNEYNDVKYWDPTLVKIHNHYYVVAINSTLNEIIQNIELNDDPKTFYKLSQYGIKIHKDLITDRFKKFASEYITEIDSSDIQEFSVWLRNLNVDSVSTSRDLVYNKELTNDVKLLLLKEGIVCKPAKLVDSDNGVLLRTNTSYNAMTNYAAYNKIIYLKNSRPVKVT